VNGRHPSPDLLIVPLTSRTESLYPGEFKLTDWAKAGLNVPTTVKRGIYTIEESLVIKGIGKLVPADAKQVEQSVRDWLELH
jgi:mRNA interferase MazF